MCRIKLRSWPTPLTGDLKNKHSKHTTPFFLPHCRQLCVPFIINQTPAAGGDHCHGPQRAALSGLWAIPSTESGPQPLLDTYNLSSLALTPGEPTPYVCMCVTQTIVVILCDTFFALKMCRIKLQRLSVSHNCRQWGRKKGVVRGVGQERNFMRHIFKSKIRIAKLNS